MRPIKYQVYDPDRKVMEQVGAIDWTSSDWSIISVNTLTTKLYFQPGQNKYKLREFTGLLDKNRKEIYFDDLVKAPSGEIFKVIWYEKEMRIALEYKDTIYNFNVPLYEVVGNIYEHSNLLLN